MARRFTIVAILVLAAASCADGGQNSDSSVAAADAEFCSEFARLLGERPESYVGSEEHIADTDALLAVAPDPPAGALRVLRAYLTSGAIDPTSDPDSNLFENWPDDVQTAVIDIDEFALTRC